MNKLSLITTLLFFLILTEVKAMSFGTVLKKDFVTIKSNESAKFEILLWNVEEKSYQVQIEVEKAPENWFVIVQPKEFLLNSSSGDEYINLPYSEKPAKAFSVRVFVKPENAKPGDYEILIKARAGFPSEGIVFLQEREFKLRVEIEGETIENKTSNETEKFSPLAGKLIEESSSILSYILVIICILVVSGLIYKYA
ncbi:MAG: hypothetical protein QXG39_00715 [Candidatus Aenigmatarchaeota archaeon]